MARSADKKKRSGNNKGTDLDAFVSFPGVDNVEGTIVSHDKNGVIFEYMRYGSRYKQFFPANRIIACLGSVGSNECQLWHNVPAKTLWDKGKRDRPIPISEPEVYGDLLKSSSPDFGVILLNPAYVSIIGKTTGETGRRGRKKKPGQENAPPKPRDRSKKPKKAGAEKKKADWDE